MDITLESFTGTSLKHKENILTIEVANSWENRLIGDSLDQDKDIRTLRWQSGLLEGKKYKAGRYTFTTYLNEASDFGDIKNKPTNAVIWFNWSS